MFHQRAKVELRGCLESPRKPSEALPLGAGHAGRRLAGETTQHQPAHRQVNHGLTARREVFILFAQPSIPSNPGDRAFHHPAARQHREGGHGRRFHADGVPAPAPGALHDFSVPAALLRYPGTELLPAIGHVRPEVLQPSEGRVGGGEQPRRHVRIPQVGGMDEDTQQETRCVNEEMALAAVEFFGAVVAARPPFSVVFTVCASIIAAEGWGERPMRVRTSSRS